MSFLEEIFPAALCIVWYVNRNNSLGHSSLTKLFPVDKRSRSHDNKVRNCTNRSFSQSMGVHYVDTYYQFQITGKKKSLQERVEGNRMKRSIARSLGCKVYLWKFRFADSMHGHRERCMSLFSPHHFLLYYGHQNHWIEETTRLLSGFCPHHRWKGRMSVCFWRITTFNATSPFIRSKWKKRTEIDFESLNYYLAPMISTSVNTTPEGTRSTPEDTMTPELHQKAFMKEVARNITHHIRLSSGFPINTVELLLINFWFTTLYPQWYLIYYFIV